MLLPHASCTLSDRGKNVAPVLKRGVAAEPALAGASDDERERRLRVLLLDEGSIATTDKAEGCRWGRSTYPARSTLDPLQGRRSSKVLVARNRLLRAPFRARPRVAADTIVQSLSGDADALLDCYNEKDLQTRAFGRAAEGIRTLDLLHGKQSAGLGAERNIPANRPLLPRERVPPMPGIYREITGVSGLKPDWR